MSTNKLNSFLSASLKSGVALLPLAIAFAQMPASAQPKTKAQLEAEAAAAKAAAQSGADADDAAAAAQIFGGLTGASKSTESAKDIVVTGTNIRGVAPTGSNLTVVSSDDIAATGQMSTDQLLTTIPGFSNFNTVPNNAGAASQGTTAGVGRPNLRGTPDGDRATAGLGDPGSATLILIDGNRQSGGGIRSTATDPDSIPPALLERVEINTDGGSASYGSDAIGGVINFVTKKKYDGVEVSGRLGYADKYWQYDGNVLVGKDWGSGSAYISGNYSYNTPLYRRDRLWTRQLARLDGRLVDLSCDLPNISIAATAASGSGATFVPAIPVHYYKVDAAGNIIKATGAAPAAGIPTGDVTGLTSVTPIDASPPNLCALSDRSTLLNKRERYGAAASFYQKITDNIDFQARANYSYFGDYGIIAPFAVSIHVSPDNPWRDGAHALASSTGTPATYPTAQVGFPTPIDDSGKTYSVITNLSQVYGDKDMYSHTWNIKYGANAEVTWRVDGNWQVKGTALWDRTTTKQNYGLSAFGGLTFLDPYQDNGISPNYAPGCQAATIAYAAVGGNTQANAGNAAALAARAAARQVCLDPYNPEDSNPAILAAAHNVDSKTRYQDTIQDYKVNLDGALLTIPGGKVRIAVGGEYSIETLKRDQYSNGVPIPFSAIGTPYQKAPLIANPNGVGNPIVDPRFRPTGFDPSQKLDGSKWIWSVYGEMNIPLVSRANELTWVKEFRIQLAGRYDRFQGYGGSFNPKVGLSFKPTSWIGFRGNYSTSFRTPSATANVALNTISISPAVGGSVALAPNLNPPINPDQVVWGYNQGATPNLRPSHGDSWSVGIDLTPFRGFRATVNYQHINYKDRLASPNPLTVYQVRGNAAALAALGLTGLQFPDQGCVTGNLTVVLDEQVSGGPARPSAVCQVPTPSGGTNTSTSTQDILTPAQIAQAKAAFVQGALNAADILADTRPVYLLADGRFTNAGNNKIGILDYSLSYNSRTPWGSVNFAIKGTVQLISKTQATNAAGVPQGPYTPDGAFLVTSPSSRHAMTVTAGFTYGPLRASVNLSHSDGYNVTATLLGGGTFNATSPQTHVGAFNVVNFFGSWEFKGDNVIEKGLQLTLSVNNALNATPPIRYATAAGTSGVVTTANGSTIGRVIQIGFNKKF